MGTRSLTVFYDDDGTTEIAVLYRQFDGHPDGHGADLSAFLAGQPIVNGLSGPTAVFNGMGCLAAAVVGHFMDGPGGFYLYPAGSRDCGEEWVYHVRGKPGDDQATVEVVQV